MPERHSTGSSSSGSSSSHSSSSGSSSSSWHRHSSDGPSSPDQQAISCAILIILLVVAGVAFVANQVREFNTRRDNANATATTQAIIVRDLAEMHGALDA